MSNDEHNRLAYSLAYEPSQIDPTRPTRYDAEMVTLRHRLVSELGVARDVVDLGCGTGEYLIPHLSSFRSAIGIDFSQRMLDELERRLGGPLPHNLRLRCADIVEMDLPPSSADLIFSFSTLYYVPRLSDVLAAIASTLRSGGWAVLELGNLRSLNVLIWNAAARAGAPWARHHVMTFSATRDAVAATGLTVKAWRSFQVLPFSGITRRVRLLYPLAHPGWKHLLGLPIGSKLLDERLSSLPLMRNFAFRHLVVLKRE